jgi:hypothetical protein
VNPQAISYNQFLGLLAHPTDLTRGFLGASPTLAFHFFGYQRTGFTDVAVSVPFGNPFSGSTAACQALHVFLVPVRLGTNQTAYLNGDLGFTADRSACSGNIQPLISPVEEPKINGGDAFAVGQTDVTTSPTLSWAPPTIGTASEYRVMVWKVTASSGATRVEQVATIRTEGTSVVIPPGVMSASFSYVFQLQAISQAVDVAQAPYQLKVPYGFATAVTALVAP